MTCSKPIPQALYSCCNKWCAEEHSFPASDLNWCEEEKGWMCGDCFCDEMPAETVRGITLADNLAQSALSLIAAERRRQVEELGYTAEKDDLLEADMLAMAASFYSWPDGRNIAVDNSRVHLWPFAPETRRYPFEPDRLRELTKAGALIVAEIERLQRKGEA
jgi:hypothetical protein